jgi:hypothetical protein
MTHLELSTDGCRLRVEERAEHRRQHAAVARTKLAVGRIAEIFLHEMVDKEIYKRHAD